MRGNYFSEDIIAMRFSYSSHSQTRSRSVLTQSLHQYQQPMSCVSPSNHGLSLLITKKENHKSDPDKRGIVKGMCMIFSDI